MKVNFIIKSDILGEMSSTVDWSYPTLPGVGHTICNPLVVFDQDSIDILKNRKIRESIVLTEIYPKSSYNKTVFDLIQNDGIDNNWMVDYISWDLEVPIPSIYIKDLNILDEKTKDKIFKSYSPNEQQEVNWAILNRIATEEYKKIIEHFDEKYGDMMELDERGHAVTIIAESLLNTDFIKISYWHGANGSGWCFDELVSFPNQGKPEWISNGNVFTNMSDIEHLSKINHRIKLSKTYYDLEGNKD